MTASPSTRDAEPYWASEDGDVVLHLGDCLDVLRAMEPGSIDAIVTDPPAGVSFMGREWDSNRGSRAMWVTWLAERLEEAARVLKPGGHLLVWSLPRTSHWTAWALEDAGLEIRDCVLHLFGSGFPKSLDVGKAIDRAAGAVREVAGPGRWAGRESAADLGVMNDDAWQGGADRVETAPATLDAARWEGWGTALKPGQEMWWLARKPLAAGTVAANVLEYGTGALNVDGCKVGSEVRTNNAGGSSSLQRVSRVEAGYRQTVTTSVGESSEVTGRWPTNIVFTHSVSCEKNGACASDCPVGELDRQSGSVGAAAPVRGTEPSAAVENGGVYSGRDRVRGVFHGDSGGASRFYPTFRYQAKAPTSERPRLDDGTAHETVKPLGFISWAVKLVTRPGGTVLDLFAGSGPVAEACIVEGFRCVLIEQDPKSAELIKTRLRKPIQPALFGDVA